MANNRKFAQLSETIAVDCVRRNGQETWFGRRRFEIVYIRY